MPPKERPSITCDICNKKVLKKNFSRHKRNLHKDKLFNCSKCDQSFFSKQKLDIHTVRDHPRPVKAIKCKHCDMTFASIYKLARHRSKEHQSTSQQREVSIDLDEIAGGDEALIEELQPVKHFLVEDSYTGNHHAVFNFPIRELRTDTVRKCLKGVFKKVDTAFKMNFAFGFVLKSIEGDYRYYYAHNNNTVFDRPKLITKEEDVDDALTDEDSESFLEKVSRERPDTKWRFFQVTNLTVFVYNLPNVRLGCPTTTLPSPMLHNNNVLCFNDKRDHLCLFRAVCVGKNDGVVGDSLEDDVDELFEKFLDRFPEFEAEDYDGVDEDHIPAIEELVGANIVIYGFDIENDQNYVGVLLRRSLEKFPKTIYLLKYDNHVCYLKDVQAFFKRYSCPNCQQNWTKLSNYTMHLKTCNDLIRHVYPGGVYQVPKTIFEELDDIGIRVPMEKRLFPNLVIFDFESYNKKPPISESSAGKSTNWVGQHVPITVSISTNMSGEVTHLHDADPYKLVESFCTRLTELQKRSSAEMREKFADIFNELRERSSEQRIEGGEQNERSTPERKEYLITRRLLSELEKYCDVLPCFGFNSSRYDLNLIKEYLLTYLINTENCPPQVIKRTNQYISLEFKNLRFLDILNFLGGATNLNNFLKAYQAQETKGFFPHDWLDEPSKLEQDSLPSYTAFFNKLKGHNDLGVDFDKYMKLRNSGYTVSLALKKLKLNEVPCTLEENYQYLVKVWCERKMKTMKDFIRWYNDKDVVPTLEAMQNMMRFYHEKGMDVLKLGNTLPNIANRFLHKSTDAKFFRFSARDRDLAIKLRKDIVGGPSIVFKRYSKVNETYVGDSQNLCKAIVGVDANQLYPYAMCQEMPTGPYVRYDLRDKDPNGKYFYPQRLYRSELELKILGFIQSKRPQCKIVSLYTQGTQKRIGPYFVDGFCAHCNTVWEVMGCYFHYCECCKENVPPEDISKMQKKREDDQVRRKYLEDRGYDVVEYWECEWYAKTGEIGGEERLFIHNNFVQSTKETFGSLFKKIRQGNLFGIVECRVEVPEHLKDKFSEFPPIFKNTEVGREDIGQHMREYAEENDLLKKPRRMLISSLKLEKGYLITPLFNYLITFGLKCLEIYSFIQFTPRRCFQSFVNEVVEARREGDKNKESAVIAETMKLIGNSSYGYQLMDRSRHTLTKYANEKNIHNLFNRNRFKQLSEISDDIYEVGFSRRTVEHKEPLVVGFFILQYAKMRMLELYYNLLLKYLDRNKFSLIYSDTDCIYMELAHEKIEECIRDDMKIEYHDTRKYDCKDCFQADSETNFFPRTCCDKHTVFDNRTPGLFKEEFRCNEMIALCSKTYCAYHTESRVLKLSSKGVNKNLIDEPLNKYRKVLFEEKDGYSLNRGFRVVKNKSIFTYEQEKRGLPYFYPKRIVLDDGINTLPLHL